MDSDPYKTLGVGRDADLAAVKRAFREAALRCHPDRCPDDPAAAARRFHRLTEAYKAVSRALDPSLRRGEDLAAHKTLNPSELAQMGIWPGSAHDPWEELGEGPRPRSQWVLFRRRAVHATIDETLAFVGFWTLALVAAVLSVPILALALGMYGRTMDNGDAALLVVGAFAVYAATVAAGLYGILLTRKIVWLAVRLGALARKALPAPVRQPRLPRRRLSRVLAVFRRGAKSP